MAYCTAHSVQFSIYDSLLGADTPQLQVEGLTVRMSDEVGL